jgi:phage-related protein (TIGR01555 family)
MTEMINIDGYYSFVANAAPAPTPVVFVPTPRLDETQLAEVYEGDAIAARIVDSLPRDATRVDWDLSGVDEFYDWRALKSEIDDLQAVKMIGRAWKWARLQGAAILVIGANDGKPIDQPLDLSKVTGIAGLAVLDCTQIRPEGPNLFRGSNIEQPTWYRLNDPADSNQALVHHSRVIRFDSFEVPARRLIEGNGFPPSVLQRCWSSLTDYRQAHQDLAALSKRMSVLVLRIANWKKTAMATPAEQAKLQNWLREMFRAMDAHNLLAIDKEDEFEEVKRSLEGVGQLLETKLSALVADSDVTRQIITGTQTSTGLNSDTKGERHAWYDLVAVERRVTVDPAMNRLIEINLAAKHNRTGEQVPTEWEIEWEPLEQEAAADKADRATKWVNVIKAALEVGLLNVAQGLQILLDRGIIEPTELLEAAEAANESEPDVTTEPEPAANEAQTGAIG